MCAYHPPATRDEAKQRLSFFNQKFERIAGYSFFKSGPTSFKMKSDNVKGTVEIETQHPSDEQIDAVLLGLRFFVVTNEGTSLHRIRDAYVLLAPPAEIQADFDKMHTQWTDWMKRPSRMGGYTNEDFFNHMIYGERVHRNQKDHYEIYDQWMSTRMMADFVIVELCNTIDDITRLVFGIYHVNKKALAVV